MLPRGCAKQTLRFTKAEDKMYVIRHQLDCQEVALLGGIVYLKFFLIFRCDSNTCPPLNIISPFGSRVRNSK